MIREFSFQYEQLGMEYSHIEELLGFEQGQAPDPFPEMILNGLKIAPNFCKAKGGFVIFDQVKPDSQKGTLTIEDQVFIPAQIVNIQLKQAVMATVMVCTAGNEISIESNRLNENGDLLTGYILDVIGSVIVDRAMDLLHDEVQNVALTWDMDISDRFSPGYCEWKVAEQQKLFALLPKNFCGIELSASSLMKPIKSASGITGIGKGLKRKGYQCFWCNDPECIYGKVNRKKNRKKVV